MKDKEGMSKSWLKARQQLSAELSLLLKERPGALPRLRRARRRRVRKHFPRHPGVVEPPSLVFRLREERLRVRGSPQRALHISGLSWSIPGPAPSDAG